MKMPKLRKLFIVETILCSFILQDPYFFSLSPIVCNFSSRSQDWLIFYIGLREVKKDVMKICFKLKQATNSTKNSEFFTFQDCEFQKLASVFEIQLGKR